MPRAVFLTGLVLFTRGYAHGRPGGQTWSPAAEGVHWTTCVGTVGHARWPWARRGTRRAKRRYVARRGPRRTGGVRGRLRQHWMCHTHQPRRRPRQRQPQHTPQHDATHRCQTCHHRGTTPPAQHTGNAAHCNNNDAPHACITASHTHHNTARGTGWAGGECFEGRPGLCTVRAPPQCAMSAACGVSWAALATASRPVWRPGARLHMPRVFGHCMGWGGR